MLDPLRAPTLSGIYKIANLVNGKYYIGSASNLRWRLGQHRSTLESGKHMNRHLLRAWKRYGQEAFGFSILAICAPRDLLFYEQRFIDALGPSYNILRVAGSVRGYRHSAETRARIGAASRGRPRSPEVCAKISLAQKGKPRAPLSPAHRAKIAARMRGNQHARGHPHTAEWKAAAAARYQATVAAGGDWHLPDNTGRPHSEGRRERARARYRAVIAAGGEWHLPNNTGRRPSAEARAKMSAAGKARAARQARQL